jgi:hypothetical protein
VKGQGEDGDWHKVAVGNRDSEYMKEGRKRGKRLTGRIPVDRVEESKKV